MMNPELEPPEKFSEPPKSTTDTLTINQSQLRQKHAPEIAARYRYKLLAHLALLHTSLKSFKVFTPQSLTMTNSILANSGKLKVYSRFIKLPPRVHERPKGQLALSSHQKKKRIC
jgi:hypothetical protein